MKNPFARKPAPALIPPAPALPVNEALLNDLTQARDHFTAQLASVRAEIVAREAAAANLDTSLRAINAAIAELEGPVNG